MNTGFETWICRSSRIRADSLGSVEECGRNRPSLRWSLDLDFSFPLAAEVVFGLDPNGGAVDRGGR